MTRILVDKRPIAKAIWVRKIYQTEGLCWINTVDKDSLYHADMETNATEEIHVGISMRQNNAIDAKNVETQSNSANSVVKVTAEIAPWESTH